MTTYYATFGSGHAFAKFYVEIEADSNAEARNAMSFTFAQKWSFVYEESMAKEAVHDFNLRRLCLLRPGTSYPWEAVL